MLTWLLQNLELNSKWTSQIEIDFRQYFNLHLDMSMPCLGRYFEHHFPAFLGSCMTAISTPIVKGTRPDTDYLGSWCRQKEMQQGKPPSSTSCYRLSFLQSLLLLHMFNVPNSQICLRNPQCLLSSYVCIPEAKLLSH